MRLALILTLFCSVAAGAQGRPPRPVQPTPCRAPAVPQAPPDSVPSNVYHPGRMSADRSPFMAGDFPRDLVFVRFRPDATQAQKQVAADAVCGVVVGGMPLTRTYVLSVADHAEAAVLFGAIEVLERLPQVAEAYANGYLVPVEMVSCVPQPPHGVPRWWSAARGVLLSTIDGRPVRSAQIDLRRIGPDGAEGALHRVHSAEDGSFAIGVPPGEYALMVFHVGYNPLWSRISLVEPTDGAVTIRLGPMSACAG